MMDYVRINGRFTRPAGQQIMVWGLVLLGAALIADCDLFAKRPQFATRLAKICNGVMSK
jgi:hypothetical protein